MENIKKAQNEYFKNVRNLRAFKIKYLGATNTKGTRFKITDLRHNKSKIIYKDYEFNSGKENAYAYLKSIGIKIKYSCELDQQNDLLLSENFDVMLK